MSSFLNSPPNTGRLLGSALQSTGGELLGHSSLTIGPSTQSSSFGETSTTIKFHPLSGSDTALENGRFLNLNTKYQCITCMKEYEHKSLEELRFEDYAAGRKSRNTTNTFDRTTFSSGSIPAASPSGFTLGNSGRLYRKAIRRVPKANNTFGRSIASSGTIPAAPNSAYIVGISSKPLFGTAATTIRNGRTAHDTFGSTTCSSGYPAGPSSGFIFGTSDTITGTTIKFRPPCGSDTVLKKGVSCNINTKHQCITCMVQYQDKSLEELRFEDYAAGRKSRNTSNTFDGTTFSSGSIPGAPTSGFTFGNSSKPLFETPATNSEGRCSPEDEQKLLKCIICFENERNVVFQPCSHLAVCLSCSNRSMSDCPVCRKRITNKLKIFVS